MRPYDFLDYWDTRIEANQQLFDNHPHMANFAFSECMALWEDMKSDYAALLARHNALVEAVAWEREGSDYRVWIIGHQRFPKKRGGFWEVLDIFAAARAEVDRLIGGE